MTLIVVHPGGRWLAADRRGCYGHMFDDTLSKIRKVQGTLLAACGVPRLLDVAVSVAWEEWKETSVRELVPFAEKVREHMKDELDDGELPGEIVVATGGRAYSIESNLSVIPIVSPTAFGSGNEGAQPLLNYGLSVEQVFHLVASCNYTVSPSFDRELF